MWAFGHSFEAAGARSLLLQDAYVFKVVNDPNASLTGGSYKLAVAGHDLGTLTNDAFSAVVGRLGALPTLDLRHRLRHRQGHRRKKFVDSTVPDETDVDTPTGFTALGAVAPLAVAEAAGGVLRSSPGRLTGRMCLRITFRERPKQPGALLQPLSVVGDPRSRRRAARQPGRVQRGASTRSTRSALIEAYEGRTPHVSKVDADVEMRRGEQLAFLRSVRRPSACTPASASACASAAARARRATSRAPTASASPAA